MAALDFPASPTNGQVFSAPNGVVYIWSLAYTAWLAQSPPPVTGQFAAFRASGLSLTGSPVVIVPNTVTLGNNGNWYNIATGRYTPPAGGYLINFGCNVYNGGGTNGSTVFELRKNGVAIGFAGPSTATGTAVEVEINQLTTADGTDYFEVFGYTAASQGLLSNVSFQAFQMAGSTGVQGPPGSQVGNGAVMATSTSNAPPGGGTAAVIVFPTVVTGNSGSWLNTTTGRYTPPAGRYHIEAGCSFYSSSGGIYNQTYIRKNGVAVITSYADTAAANRFCTPYASAIFDMNGTDYVDIAAACNISPSGASTHWFCAHPVSTA
jgi:hypothetical protein